MKTILALSLLSVIFISGCANSGVVQIAPDTFMLSREDHGGMFGNPSALRAGVFRDANTYAENQGKVAIPISAKAHPMGILADWASFELVFKMVGKDDPLAKNPPILEESGKQDGQGWRNLGGEATTYTTQALPEENNNSSNKTLGQQLSDLQKAKEDGAITDEEFQIQKAKLLAPQ